MMFKYCFPLSLVLLVTGCVSNKVEIAVSTPASLTITAPRNLSTGRPTLRQDVYDLAEEHCQKTGRNAVHIKAWVVPFDADYFEFECK